MFLKKKLLCGGHGAVLFNKIFSPDCIQNRITVGENNIGASRIQMK